MPLPSKQDDENAAEEQALFNLKYPKGKVNDNTPVVFVIGWFGSTSKVLSKFADIYLNKNCITICFPQGGIGRLFEDPLGKTKIENARKLAQILVTNDLAQNPVLCHVLSNGGNYQYYHLTKQLQAQKAKLIGAVMDSCPSTFSLENGYNACYKALKANLPNVVALWLTNAWWLYNILAEPIRSRFLSARDAQYEIYISVARHKYPQLYLYSEADDLIPKTDVEFVIREAKKNAPVWSHNFLTSPHVQHFRLFPEVYRRKCEEFLEFCLRRSIERQIPVRCKL